MRCRLLEPGIVAAERVLAPGLVVEPEVALHQRHQVGRRLAREHALDDVLVAGVALGLLLEDPAARLASRRCSAARRGRASWRCSRAACRRTARAGTGRRTPTIAVPCTAKSLPGSASRQRSVMRSQIGSKSGHDARVLLRAARPLLAARARRSRTRRTRGRCRRSRRPCGGSGRAPRGTCPSTTGVRSPNSSSERRNWSRTHSSMNSLNELRAGARAA